MRSSHEIVALMMTMFSFTPVAASAATGAPPADTEPPVSPTKPATLVVSTFDGEARLHFNPAVISEEYLDRAAALGPYLAAPRASFNGVCAVHDGEEEYCDTRVLFGPDLGVAESELDEMMSLLGDLAGLAAPSELDAVLAYVRRETAFYACLRNAALEYYHGDDSALSAVCEDIDAAAACSDFVRRAPLMRTPPERFRLADHGWQGCMQEHFEQTLGVYPIENWQMFLRNHGVDEIVEAHGC
jgi:hypothetical protein